jgi:zinc finger protein
LFEKLKNLIGYTIVLDDPCGNSYIESATDIVRYERSFEQNEDLGLNDIKTQNYK